MSETPVETATPLCQCGCGEHVTPGLVFGKPRKYIRGHGPQAAGKKSTATRQAKPLAATAFGESPSLDDLKAAQGDREEDRAPGSTKSRAKNGKAKRAKNPVEVPPFRAGPIAAGMNKLYARTGKLVRILDPAVGQAIIDVTRKEADDDVTVGEAWEELAKSNPRVRAFLLKMISGGAYGQLVMAHLPILLAVLMKDAIRSRLPFQKILDALLVEREDDGTEQGPTDLAKMFGDLTPEDAAQMQQMATMMMGQMGFNLGGLGRSAPTSGRTPDLGDLNGSYPDGEAA